MIRIFGVFTIICATLASAGAARSDAPVTIFAAASLRGALEAALDGSGIDARVSYGGSGTMARQVAQGAPADVVILANVAWVDWLEENGHIAVSTRTDLLGNRLVLVGPRGAADLGELNADTLLERLDAGRLAVGHTEAVPAGIYAQEWMQAAGFWEALRPQLAETENVRAALALVSRGEVPLGVVYASDAQADPGVRILARIDPDTHAPIVYPMALVTGRDSDGARAVLEHLVSERAEDAFVAHGFTRVGDLP
ncbi:Molybdate-binding periplasmic protein precursor [Roseovarius sp. THAF9]|uniref:molybdate ABC transporter substrate-binding protein n=1 Tax=Roseovarius sp. THAF9 TaxID=2587847 RepID=UPI001268C618|nr:molybdate ABC transporter substrate-binding protein [Roseovarius sp. THAF9]QFT93773.1 Molybdate-binding periplasmic protein precursor [Roseovarius sp. THAF9]